MRPCRARYYGFAVNRPEVPNHHRRGEDLNDRHRAEADEGQRRSDGSQGDRQHRLADVPADGAVFEKQRSALVTRPALVG